MKSIGIYHQVDLEALHEVASRTARGEDRPSIRQAIIALHAKQGVGKRTSEKRSRPAFKVWLSADPITALSTEYYNKMGRNDQLALQFAGMVREYPFFFDVVTQVGAQLRLGDTVRQETVRDRLGRGYGESSNVKQGVQKVLQTLISWGLLIKTADVGVYRAASRKKVGLPASEILVASLLRAESRQAIPADDVARCAALFWCTTELVSKPTTTLLQAHVEGNGQLFLVGSL